MFIATISNSILLWFLLPILLFILIGIVVAVRKPYMIAFAAPSPKALVFSSRWVQQGLGFG